MNENILPVKKKARIQVLDVLRGFAIFGIIFANIFSWSGLRFLPYEELHQLPYAELHDKVYYLFMFIVDTKFYTIFSILFGIGFYIQFNKHRDNQAPFLKTYRRRLLFLMLFGLIHTLIWSGDILMTYAIVGFVFIEFRNIKPSRILGLAIFFYFAWLLYDFVFIYAAPDFMTYTSEAMKHYPDMSPQEVAHIFKTGSVIDVWKLNLHNVTWRYFDFIPSGRITKILGLFLLGFYLMSSDYFNTYAKSIKLTILLFVLGVGTEWVARHIGGGMSKISHDWNNVAYKFLAAFGQITLALSYINIITLLYENKFFKKILDVFKPVGQTSFTSYLMQTAIGILLFYNFFGDLWGTMGIAQLYVLCFIIFTGQVICSSLWLKYFTFGPLEWLWRCLTYRKVFPIVRKKELSA